MSNLNKFEGALLIDEDESARMIFTPLERISSRPLGNLPEVEVTFGANNSRVTLRLSSNAEDDNRSLASTFQGEQEVNIFISNKPELSDFIKMRHNLVLSCLTGSRVEGRSMRSLKYKPNVILPQAFLNLTPDHIVRSEQIQAIFELKVPRDLDGYTMIGEERVETNKVIESELINYKSSLIRYEDYMGVKTLFHYLVVDRDYIIATFEVDDMLAEEIAAHYELGELLIREYIGRNPSRIEKLLEVPRMAQILRAADLSLPHEGDPGLNNFMITEEDVARWENRAATLTPQDFSEYCKALLIEGTQDAHDLVANRPNYYDDWIKEHKKLPRRPVTDIQSISRFPMVNVTLAEERTNDYRDFNRFDFKISEADARFYEEVLFLKAMRNVKVNKERFTDHTEEMREEAMKTKKEYEMSAETRKSYRGLYHLAQVKMDIGEIKHLMERGVGNVKNQKLNDPTIEQLLEENKEFIDIDCSIDDIESFIQVDGFKKLEELGEVPIDYETEQLEKISRDVHKEMGFEWRERPSTNFVNWFRKTLMYRELLLISEINCELAMSSSGWIRDDKGDFILKKLPSFDVYVMIKPYGATKNLYYWLYIPYTAIETFPDTSTLFKQFKRGKFGFYTESETINRHKVSHFMMCHETLMCYYSLWLDIYRTTYDSVSEKTSEATKMFFLQFLLYFDQKKSLVDAMQYPRYYYMELLKGAKSDAPNPEKVFKSIPTTTRSRLHCFLVRKLKINADIMKDKPFQFSRDLSEITDFDNENQISNAYDNMIGLRNAFTGGEISTAREVVNIMYVGYATNKDDINEDWSKFAILKKIISEARKDANVRWEYLGRSDIPRDPVSGKVKVSGYRPHEGSMTYCTLMGVHTRKFLEKKHNNRFSEHFYKEFAKLTNDQLYPKYMTMKASMVKHKLTKFTLDPEKIKQINRRVKCLEAILLRLKKKPKDSVNVKPFEEIIEILEEVERDGAMVNLFMKNQVFGVREIYVLDMAFRLLCSFVEHASRVVCGDMPAETMTKPENKEGEVTRFNKNVADMTRGKKNKPIYMISNNDNSRWSPGMSTALMACATHAVFPKDMSRIICRILNIMTVKKLELPYLVVKKLIQVSEREKTDPDFKPTFDENIEALMHDLRGDDLSTGLVSSKHSLFMFARANWMQGILHFYSSLIHAMAYLLLATFCVSMYDHLIEISRYSDDITPLAFMGQVSSDDSRARMESAVDPEVPGASMYATQCMMQVSCMIRKQYQLWSANLSDAKSTQFVCTGFEEYNSTFGALGTEEKTLIKTGYPICKPTGSLTSKAQMLDNLKSYTRAMREYGASATTCEVAQYAQMRCYWYFQGRHSSVLYKDFAKQLINKPSSALGFYIADPPGTVGVFPAKFSEYWMCKYSEKYSKVMRSLLNWGIVNADENGLLAVDVKVKIGKGDKAGAIRERLHIPNTWKEPFYERPSLLFRDPVTIQECIYWGWNQIHKPSVDDSLSFKSVLKGYVFGMLMHANFVTLVRDTKDGVPERKAISFYKLMKDVNPATGGLDDNLMKFFFPLSEVYDSLIEVSRFWMTDSFLDTCPKKTCRGIKVNMPRLNRQAPLSFKDYFKAKYFKYVEGTTATEIMRSHIIYSAMFPWLGETFEETLSLSPFKGLGDPKPGTKMARDDVFGLAGFVESIETSTSSITLFGPFRKPSSYKRLFEILMVYMDTPGFRLVKGDRMRYTRDKDIIQQTTNISLLLTSPYKISQGEAGAEDVLRLFKEQKAIWQDKDDPILTKFNSLNKMEKNLALVQTYLQQFHGLTEVIGDEVRVKSGFIDLLRKLKTGRVGFFVEAQKRKNQWSGEGLYQLELDGQVFHLGLEDRMIKKIFVLERDSQAKIKTLRYYTQKMAPFLDNLKEILHTLRISLPEQLEAKFTDDAAQFFINLQTTKSVTYQLPGHVPVIIGDFAVMEMDEALMYPEMNVMGGEILIRLKHAGRELIVDNRWSETKKAWAREIFDHQNSVVILKYTASNYLLELNRITRPIRIEGSELINSWLSFNGVEAREGQSIIQRFGDTQKKSEQITGRAWVKRTLGSRCEYRFDLTQSSAFTIVKAEQPAVDVGVGPGNVNLKNLLDDDDKRIRAFNVQLELDVLFELGDEEEEEKFISNIDREGVEEEGLSYLFPYDLDQDRFWESIAVSEGEMKSKFIQYTIDKLHPFWDAYIEHMMILSKSDFERIMTSQSRFSKESVRLPELKSLYDVMGVGERPQGELSASGSGVTDEDAGEHEDEYNAYW
jgi:hypothetical protein